jgi:hypothetical protein
MMIAGEGERGMTIEITEYENLHSVRSVISMAQLFCLKLQKRL